MGLTRLRRAEAYRWKGLFERLKLTADLLALQPRWA